LQRVTVASSKLTKVSIRMNSFLLVGAVLSAIAALAHVAIVIGGPSWYRFFGAGEKFAIAAEQGKLSPALVTLGIALVLLVWSMVAISGSGALPPFPLLKIALCLITGIYLLRGFLGLVILFTPIFSKLKLTATFIVVSSLICLVYGVVHLVGLLQVWDKI
jgi:hypothetical protein